MTRALFSGRYLLLLLGAVVVMTRLLGVWDWKERDHKCMENPKFHLQQKVQVFQWGSLRLYAFPVEHDCLPTEQVPLDWQPLNSGLLDQSSQ